MNVCSPASFENYELANAVSGIVDREYTCALILCDRRRARGTTLRFEIQSEGNTQYLARYPGYGVLWYFQYQSILVLHCVLT